VVRHVTVFGEDLDTGVAKTLATPREEYRRREMNKQCVNLELDKRRVENALLESIVPERNLEVERRNNNERASIINLLFTKFATQ
jgi:hypothetical protein